MKYALITGASRGIGAAAAREFARRGWGVAVNYLSSRDRAETLVRELSGMGVPALAVRADVADRRQVQEMVDNVLEKFCQLDILVCNAGVASQGLLCETSDADWRRLMGVDLDGVFYCCRAVYRHMVARKTGRIVTVSSMWGRSGASCEAAYSAAKAGVIGLTKALARELGPSGITVNCVAPGVIETDMMAAFTAEDKAALAEETPVGRLGTPEEVAKLLVFLAGEDAGYITGQVFGVNGGLVI